MKRTLGILILTAALAPASAASDAVVSVALHQYAETTAGGAVLGPQGLCRMRPDAIEPLTEFLPPTMGLDGVDLQPDGKVLFSVDRDGTIMQAGQALLLRQDRVYVFDPAAGTITIALDPDALGLPIGSLDAFSRMEDGSYAFSTSATRFVTHSAGTIVLRPQSVYRLDPAALTLEPLLDGVALGLTDVDAVHAFADGTVGFSTSDDVWVMTSAGGLHLRQESAYRFASGDVRPLFDGAAHGLYTLDALDVDELLLEVDRGGPHWNGSPFDTSYDVVHGDLGELLRSRGDYAVSTKGCLADELRALGAPLATTPGPGDGMWILVRRNTPTSVGTFDSGGAGQVRSRDAGIAASGVACP